MKTFTKYTTYIAPKSNKYGPRSFAITLSNEIFTTDEIVKINAEVQKATMRSGFSITVNTETFEITETEEEAAKQEADKEAETLRIKQEAEDRRKKLMNEVIDKATKSKGRYQQAIEEAIDSTVPSWERGQVRDMLKKEDKYYKAG